jgi:uncharacterized cofD-like protein
VSGTAWEKGPARPASGAEGPSGPRARARQGGAAPRVVAIGGGHGLAATLQAVRRYAREVTAVVSVADDGGSSGRLREALGIPAPGDLRKCLVALAEDPDDPVTKAFEHRFEDGHALGNLFIAALAAETGDFQQALDQAGRVVHAQGRVLPATEAPVVLKAEAAGGPVHGQVNVSEAGRIAHVSLVPPDVRAGPGVVEAIHDADQIVIGPGSLFTSVLAALVVDDVRAALKATAAKKVYVCNLHTQTPETSGYDVAAHVDALVAHQVDPDVVLFDPAWLPVGELTIVGVEAPLSGEGAGHDPAKLASALADLVG